MMYSLLLSLPGTPVLLYGEEIGLGDDQSAADRLAVRLPMQWSSQPGGGFTRADEDKAPRKPLRDGPFGYRKLNVQAQREDNASLLNWMTRAIRTRKEWPDFGWGKWKTLGTRHEAVLAHFAAWDGTCAMAVHNFSDEPAKASIQLPSDGGRGTWRHIFGVAGKKAPPAVGRSGRLTLELPPYGYHWYGRREEP